MDSGFDCSSEDGLEEETLETGRQLHELPPPSPSTTAMSGSSAFRSDDASSTTATAARDDFSHPNMVFEHPMERGSSIPEIPPLQTTPLAARHAASKSMFSSPEEILLYAGSSSASDP